MIRSIFVLPRRGLIGGRPVGADYMTTIHDRARRLDRACRERGARLANDDERQMTLPFPEGTATLIKKQSVTLGTKK